MKKIMLAGAVAITAAATLASCSDKQNAAAENEGAALVIPSETADSVAEYYGRAFGANIVGYLDNQAARSGKELDKNEVLKGVQYVVGSTGSKSFVTGMKIGMDIKNFIEECRQNGMEVSPEIVIKNFRSMITADSISPEAQQTDYAEFSSLMNRVRMIANEKQRAEQAKKGEEAIKAGEVYVAKIKKADSEVKTSESGLSYKIINPGTEPKIGPNTTAKIKYTGKLIDGTVFDSGEAEFAPTRVVPGFGEGMQLLGKGGKATLYIPGNLGYGANGAGDKIGPNATLVFDIEVVDIPETEE